MIQQSNELAYLIRLNRTLDELTKNNDVCAYCGLLATDDEHVVPYSYLAPVATEKMRRNPKAFRKYIVRSCSNCNSLASNKMFPNFWEKKKFIASRVRSKNKKLLNLPDWTSEELEELEGRLLEHVYSQQINKKIVTIRLENLDKPEITKYEPYE